LEGDFGSLSIQRDVVLNALDISSKVPEIECQGFESILLIDEAVRVVFGSVRIGKPVFFARWFSVGFREIEVFDSGAIVTGLPTEDDLAGVSEVIAIVDCEGVDAGGSPIDQGRQDAGSRQITCLITDPEGEAEESVCRVRDGVVEVLSKISLPVRTI